MKKNPSMGRISLVATVLTLVFYIGMFLVVLLVPRLTGYTFKSDTSVLIAASLPVLLLLVLILTETATSIRAKFAGVEIEIERAWQSTSLKGSEAIFLEEGIPAQKRAEEIRKNGLTPRILVVRLVSKGGLDFAALRDYIYTLSKVTPLQYIVFVDEENTYLGFTTVEKFKEKYPQSSLEQLLEGLADRDDSDFDPDLRGTLRHLFNTNIFPDSQNLRWALDRLAYRLWDPPYGENKWVKSTDIAKLGAEEEKLQEPSSPETFPQTVLEAYRQMVDKNLPGIPLVTENKRFRGIIDKDKLTEILLSQLVQERAK